jgi:Ni,Fe-hydrogenase III small subunit
MGVFVMIIHFTHSLEMKIVAPYRKGPEPYALICAGTTGIGATAWKNLGDDIKVTVGMSECGFLSVPIVSIVMAGFGVTRLV